MGGKSGLKAAGWARRHLMGTEKVRIGFVFSKLEEEGGEGRLARS